MKIEELLKKKHKEIENLHAKVPKGTKDIIYKKYGRQNLTKITKEALYEKLKKEL